MKSLSLTIFWARRKGDRVACCSSAPRQPVQTTFTGDLEEVPRAAGGEPQVGMAGPKTVPGDAIGLGLTVFDQVEVSQPGPAREGARSEKIMPRKSCEKKSCPRKPAIVLTDGNDTGSQLPAGRAAAIAHDRRHDHMPSRSAIRPPPARTSSRRSLWKKAAQETGGQYAHASTGCAGKTIDRDLDALPDRPAETITHRLEKSNCSSWPSRRWLADDLPSLPPQL